MDRSELAMLTSKRRIPTMRRVVRWIRSLAVFFSVPVLAGLLAFLAAILPEAGPPDRGFGTSRWEGVFGDDAVQPRPTMSRTLCEACGTRHPAKSLVSPGVIRCGKCKKIMDWVVESDVATLERPNWFLQGFVPAGVSSLTRDREGGKALVDLWFGLFLRIAYRQDSSADGSPADVWNRPSTTWRTKAGDCEDHAVLLADVLGTVGYDARAVVGSYRGGGHAWVVVRSAGNEFILDQVANRPRRFPPRAELLRLDYAPTASFDRTRLHLAETESPAPASYWSRNHWTSLPIP